MDYSEYGVISTDNYREHCIINILSMSSVVVSFMRIIPVCVYSPMLIKQLFSNFHVFYIIVMIIAMQHPNMLYNEIKFITTNSDASFEKRLKHYCRQYLNFKFKTWYFLFGQIYLTFVYAQWNIHGNMTISRLISFDKKLTSLDKTILLSELTPFWCDFGFFVLLSIYNVFVSLRRYYNSNKFKQIDEIMLESQLKTNHHYNPLFETESVGSGLRSNES